MAASPMRVTATEAKDLMGLRKEGFIKTLGIIRQTADSNIKDASRRGRGSIDFDIPTSVVFRESYDPIAMRDALAEQYFDDGYDVTGTKLRIHIKWGEESKDKEPIKYPRQADILPAAPFTAAFSKQVAAQRKKIGGLSKKTSVSISMK